MDINKFQLVLLFFAHNNRIWHDMTYAKHGGGGGGGQVDVGVRGFNPEIILQSPDKLRKENWTPTDFQIGKQTLKKV